MAEYYRVKIDQNKKAYIVDQEGNKLNPERHVEIAETIMSTAQQPRYVYFGWSEQKQCHKIGISVDPDRRSGELDIEILFTIKCQMWGESSALNVEQALHSIFKMIGRHVEGEWFHLNATDIEIIKPNETRDKADSQATIDWIFWLEKDLEELNRDVCPKLIDILFSNQRDIIDAAEKSRACIAYNAALELELIAQIYQRLGYSLLVPQIMKHVEILLATAQKWTLVE